MEQWWGSKPSSLPLLPNLVVSRTSPRWPNLSILLSVNLSLILCTQYLDSSKSECLNEADDHPYQHCLTRSSLRIKVLHSCFCTYVSSLSKMYRIKQHILLLLYLVSIQRRWPPSIRLWWAAHHFPVIQPGLFCCRKFKKLLSWSGGQSAELEDQGSCQLWSEDY